MGKIENDALFLAIAHGDLVRVQSTLEAGADANAERPYSTNIDRDVLEGTESALYFAAFMGHEPIVRLLLEQGANPNARDLLTGRTALVEASAKGHLAIVKTLLDSGADPSARDALERRSCLSAAIAAENVEVAQMLARVLKKGDPEALEMACRKGRLDLAQICWDVDPKIDKTPAFKSAATSGRTNALQWLVEHGADAKKDGPSALLEAANAGKSETTRTLIEMGVPVDSRTNYGWTALHLAAYNGNAMTVETLVNAGADVHADDGTGKTPLDWAKEMGKGDNVAVLEKAMGKR